MAADGGSVFFWGKTADQEGKRSRAQRDKDDHEDVGNVAFIDSEDNTKADIKTKKHWLKKLLHKQLVNGILFMSVGRRTFSWSEDWGKCLKTSLTQLQRTTSTT